MVVDPVRDDASSVLRAHFGSAPFLLRDAERLLSRATVRTAVDSGVVVRLRRAIGVLAGEWEHDPRARHLCQARAAQLTRAGAVASHWTAVAAHVLPAPTRADAVPERPTLTLPRGGGYVDGLHLVAGTLDPVDVTTADGLVVTTLERTGLDVTSDRPLRSSGSLCSTLWRAACWPRWHRARTRWPPRRTRQPGCASPSASGALRLGAATRTGGSTPAPR